MAEIWIKEERVSKKLLDDLGHYISLDGELDIAYFIAVDGEDYVEENKNFLLDFLLFQNKYPLFISFIVYEDQTDEYITFLKENKFDFTLNYLEEKRTYYDFLGKHLYHPPCFTAKIEDSNSLALILNETFWLPAQNEFYSISFSDNLMFELGEVIEWGRKRKRSIPIFKTMGETTFITIFHDGAGCYLFSNDEKYFTLDKFISNLPRGTVITQINDTLVNGDILEED
ncbi:hypothetical protein J7E76_27660 [Bacillus sp. ISL-101]|uniref:hypothetical protein n=1 Tax=unclassified Bacillus (in: firmicutes) TaxID=185979 RepID=UPI001BEAC288|nr:MULTISPECIES: hypothetical protein [unclassified Bacillus (in: firmicutes)]MBT2632801.1 hypothetical protein [Bacillus sp. ISL-101]MBT2716479.1 hypothetical protein [Bacillus sp. ISL-57]